MPVYLGFLVTAGSPDFVLSLGFSWVGLGHLIGSYCILQAIRARFVVIFESIIMVDFAGSHMGVDSGKGQV